VRPRACTSAPPSLSFPSLTGANPSCLAKSATGAIRIGSQGGRNQVIKTFHELSAGEGLRSEGGGRETAQLFRENSKRIRRVDDRLAFPARQGLRNLAVLPERDCQDDRAASTAFCSDLATTLGPIARACGANASGGRRLATVTLMFLRAKAWARAWPILPNPTIA